VSVQPYAPEALPPAGIDWGSHIPQIASVIQEAVLSSFAHTKTLIQYTQRTLCVPAYTQTMLRGRLCDTKWGFMSHKNRGATPMTHNCRTRPAAGVCGAGVAR